MKFKEGFIQDVTYGMLVIGADMNEIFDHILFDGGDWELTLATARKDEGCQEYKAVFLDDEDSLGISAIKTCGADDWHIIFNREQDEVETLDDYFALSNSLGEYIKRIAIEYITK